MLSNYVRTRRWLTIVAKVVVSLWLLFHFSGIVLAQRFPSSEWLTDKLLLRVYRTYLEFMFLGAAHRYEAPGASLLLWFHIEYEPDANGNVEGRWITIPSLRHQGRVVWPDGVDRPHVECTRLQGMAYRLYFSSPPRDSEQFRRLVEARVHAGVSEHIPCLDVEPFFKQPGVVSRKWIASYARHVAIAHGNDQRVRTVKVYHVVHLTLPPGEVAEGRNFWEERLFYPYYMGEFNTDGVLTNASDPLLYSALPPEYLPDSDQLYDQGVMVRAPSRSPDDR
jgi:hypothetical protein